MAKNINPRKEAKKLLDNLGIKEAPVPVERIAESLNAQIRFSPMDDELSGLVFDGGDCVVIGVNLNHHPHRQRFTIAHEIAHVVMHRAQITAEVHVDRGFKVMMRDTKAAQGTDQFEIEANQFASELLMPKEFIIEALQSKNIDIVDESILEELAMEFKVSRQALEYRMASLVTSN